MTAFFHTGSLTTDSIRIRSFLAASWPPQCDYSVNIPPPRTARPRRNGKPRSEPGSGELPVVGGSQGRGGLRRLCGLRRGRRRLLGPVQGQVPGRGRRGPELVLGGLGCRPAWRCVTGSVGRRPGLRVQRMVGGGRIRVIRDVRRVGPDGQNQGWEKTT